MADETTARRKDSHLEVCTAGEVEPDGNRTLFECVHLVHRALPELSAEEVDLSTTFLGKRLSFPLILTGMTGGTERASRINRDLALLAERHGLAFGLGSQRAMVEEAGRARTFAVREVAPNAVVLGNIGLSQAVRLDSASLCALRDAVGADGLALHLNAAQELSQPEGDRDFRGGLAAVAKLVDLFGDRLVVKETGCGISPEVAKQLQGVGVRNIDVSGLGGTSWVRVEEMRAGRATSGGLEGWGIPTAPAVLAVRRSVGNEVKLVASGGIRTGLDLAKAIVLGADLAGMALPFLRAQQAGGLEALEEALLPVVASARAVCLLTGSKTLAELQRVPRVLTGEFNDWVSAMLDGKEIA